MKITRQRLRKLIREAIISEQVDDGTGESAVRAFIVDELLANNDKLTKEDIVQQSEGAGFDSAEVEEILVQLIETEVLEEKEEFIVVV